jgi:hypothetical protein
MNVLTIDTHGIVSGLYTEAIPLTALGALRIERLTSIEFNNSIQQWEVRDRSGTLLFADSSREECLRWEHERFNVCV